MLPKVHFKVLSHVEFSGYMKRSRHSIQDRQAGQNKPDGFQNKAFEALSNSRQEARPGGGSRLWRAC